MSRDNKEFLIEILLIVSYIGLWYLIPILFTAMHFFVGVVGMFVFAASIEESLVNKWEEKNSEKRG